MTTGLEIEIAVAVVAIAGGAAAWLRRPRDRSVAAWALLAPVVNGTTRANVLSGAYDGLPVRARIVGDGSEGNPYAYEVSFAPGAQGANWSLTFTGQKFLGTGDKAWRVKSKDEALAQKLTDAGAAQAMQGWASTPEITFNAKSGNLEYRDRAEGEYAVPAVDQFRAQLALLARLAVLQRDLNTEPRGIGK